MTCEEEIRIVPYNNNYYYEYTHNNNDNTGDKTD